MDILQFMFLREKIVNLLGEVDGSLGEEWAITGMGCPVTGCRLSPLQHYWRLLVTLSEVPYEADAIVPLSGLQA